MAVSKTRIATGRVVLHRNGKKIIINAGEKFDFTQEELDSVLEVNPDALRKLVNEDDSAPEAKIPTAKTANLTKSVNAETKAKADAKNGGADKSDNKSEDL